MANTINTIKSTVAKMQKPQSHALAGPTQSGVQGVGAKPTPKRPDSERKPSIVTNHVTKPGMHEEFLGESTFTSNKGEYGGTHDSHGVKYEVKHEKREGDVYPETHHVYHNGEHIGHIRPMTWNPTKKIPGSRLVRHLGTRKGWAFHLKREHGIEHEGHLKYHQTSEFSTKKAALQALANHHKANPNHWKPPVSENKDSETTANRYMGKWLERHKEYDPNQKDDYFSHAAKKVENKPRVGKPVSGKGRNIYENRETLHPDEGYKHGDIVHWQEPRTRWHSGIDSGTVVTKILRGGPTKYHIKRFHDGSSVEKYHHEIIHYHRPVNEDAPVMAAGGASDPGLVQNPNVNYAASLAKKVKKVIAKRKMQK